MADELFVTLEPLDPDAEMADLVRASPVVGPGLRALAAEVPQRAVARGLRRVADRVDAGRPLDEALAEQGAAFPEHLRGVVLAAIPTGRLPEALEEFVALQRNRIALRRHVLAALTYPVLLISMLLSILAAYSVVLIPEFEARFTDMGFDLPLETKWVLSTFGRGLWIFIGALAGLGLVLAVLPSIGGPAWVQRTFQTIPVIGPLVRWSELAAFARLMGLMVEQQLPPPAALRLAAYALPRRRIAAACRAAAVRAEAGMSLADSLARDRRFPPTLAAAVACGNRPSERAAAFRAAAELYEGRTRACARLLAMIATPAAVVSFIGLLAFMLWALLIPFCCITIRLT